MDLTTAALFGLTITIAINLVWLFWQQYGIIAHQQKTISDMREEHRKMERDLLNRLMVRDIPEYIATTNLHAAIDRSEAKQVNEEPPSAEDQINRMFNDLQSEGFSEDGVGVV